MVLFLKRFTGLLMCMIIVVIISIRMLYMVDNFGLRLVGDRIWTCTVTCWVLRRVGVRICGIDHCLLLLHHPRKGKSWRPFENIIDDIRYTLLVSALANAVHDRKNRKQVRN